MTIFTTKPGIAVKIVDTAIDDTPLNMAIDGFKKPYDSFNAIITHLAIDREGNIQFSHTLSDFVYGFAFGERISPVIISGIAVAKTCPAPKRKTGQIDRGRQPSDVPIHGLEWILGYYEDYRATRNGLPVAMQIGSGYLQKMFGFLTKARVEIAEAEMRLCQFTLQFMALPTKSYTGSTKQGAADNPNGEQTSPAVTGPTTTTSSRRTPAIAASSGQLQ